LHLLGGKMANIKSAIKRIKTSIRNRKRNLLYKNKLKNLIKKTKKAVSQKKEDAEKLVKEAIKLLDKIAGKKIIHKNQAARKKSRLLDLFKKSKK
jgi:small subunit ribosomal protein S20